MSAYVVSREDLSHNIEYLKKQARGVPIWAVIKGNGYGIGALPLAELLSEHGIDRFCVTEVREAALLRENGFSDAKILMLRSLNDEETIDRLLDLRVILTVGSTEAAKTVDRLATQRADIAQVHLKIDTGMGRYGFLPEEIEPLAAVYRECKHLAVCGIYTHFNCAFGKASITRREFAAFQSTVLQLQAAGLETGTVHCCNSAAFLRFPEMHCGGVRLGSAILGRMPFSTKLCPVGYAESAVDEIRPLPAGHSTGYAAIWTAKRETRLAIVPVGWYHGFRARTQPNWTRTRDRLRDVLSALRALLRRERLYVTVNGHRCPVVGSIGMLHCAVDVTNVPCAPGDPVLLQINPLHVKGMKLRYQ